MTIWPAGSKTSPFRQIAKFLAAGATTFLRVIVDEAGLAEGPRHEPSALCDHATVRIEVV